MLKEREEKEQQLEEQVKLYQDELQRESEDNGLLRNTLSHLEEQIDNDKQQLVTMETRLTEVLSSSESLAFQIENLQKENQNLKSLTESKEHLKELEKVKEDLMNTRSILGKLLEYTF